MIERKKFDWQLWSGRISRYNCRSRVFLDATRYTPLPLV